MMFEGRKNQFGDQVAESIQDVVGPDRAGQLALVELARAQQDGADAGGVGPGDVSDWIAAVPPGAEISLYVHIPFCRRLCWFCACRTQGTSTAAPVACIALITTWIGYQIGLVDQALGGPQIVG